MEPAEERPVIAIVTFTDARDEGISNPEVEEHLRKRQGELKTFLEEHDISVIDPLEHLRGRDSSWYGIRGINDIGKTVDILSHQRVDGVIIGTWTWSSPMFIKDFIRKFPKPLLYYSENDPFSGSLSQLAATCSSLMEWSVNVHALKHERVFGNRERILPWARGISAVSSMRESALMLWGGTYAVKMDQLQDDFLFLKSFMVRDILQEDQYILIKEAEKIRAEAPARCREFWDWCTRNGMNIVRDERMVTDEALQKQAALLLAARDRLEELEEENIRGVSIKCQPEIYAGYGVNACTLPAFLPFALNETGEQKVYPTVCEGDVKGLLTSMVLHGVNREVPPFFGDLVSVEKGYVEFANCGAGSLFWAGYSNRAEVSFPGVEAGANIHGNTGAAFNYFSPTADEVTVARLTRINGKYFMQMGTGKALDSRKVLEERLGSREKQHLAGTWGKLIVELGVDAENFVRVIGANHLHATLGDVTEELVVACRQWDIPILRLDSDEELVRFYSDIRSVGQGRHIWQSGT